MSEEEHCNIEAHCSVCKSVWMTDKKFHYFICPTCGHIVTENNQPKPQLTLIQGGKESASTPRK